MKLGLVLAVFVGFIGLTVMSVTIAEDKITQDMIKMDTPQKASKGIGTEVLFNHKKHADERNQGCDKCHPLIKPVVNAPENNQQLVHDACRVCHDKDKPAKTFACQSCHVSKT